MLRIGSRPQRVNTLAKGLIASSVTIVADRPCGIVIEQQRKLFAFAGLVPVAVDRQADAARLSIAQLADIVGDLGFSCIVHLINADNCVALEPTREEVHRKSAVERSFYFYF